MAGASCACVEWFVLDDLGLVEPYGRLHEGVIERIADGADAAGQAGLEQRFGEGQRWVWRACIAVMHESVGGESEAGAAPGEHGLLQRTEHRSAKNLERLRAAGTLDSYSADEAVGITVNQLMFRKGITRKQLGEALGVTGPAAGRKLRGEIGWSLADLFVAADFFNIEVTALLPRKAKEDPALTNQDGISGVVAGTGFEPVTSGL